MNDLFVVVGIPGGTSWSSKFCLSMVGMVTDFARRIPGFAAEQRLRIHHRTGSILPQLRQQLMLQALREGATHLLFVDSDQTFPPDIIRRLLSWRVPVVACNVAVKRFPSSPTARLKGEDEGGVPLFTREKDTGLERVWRIGTGVMLIDLSICKHLGPLPWFQLTWKENACDFEGEDWYFCRRVQEAGYFIYADQGLSWQIGHVGDLEFKHDFVISARDYPDLQNDDSTPILIPELKYALNEEGSHEDRGKETEDEQRGDQGLQVQGCEGRLREVCGGGEARVETKEQEVVEA